MPNPETLYVEFVAPEGEPTTPAGDPPLTLGQRWAKDFMAAATPMTDEDLEEMARSFQEEVGPVCRMADGQGGYVYL